VLLGGSGEGLPLNLVCPHRKQFSPAVRQLHGFLAERLAPLLVGLPVPAGHAAAPSVRRVDP